MVQRKRKRSRTTPFLRVVVSFIEMRKAGEEFFSFLPSTHLNSSFFSPSNSSSRGVSGSPVVKTLCS